MRPRSPRTALGRFGPFALAFGLGCSLDDCRGEDPPPLNCDDRLAQFEEVAAAEGVLLDAIPDTANFPMALTISEEGVNKLLFGVSGKEPPFASDLSLGLGKMRFTPTSTPVVELASVPGCSRCILFALDFTFAIVNNNDESQGAGVGNVVLSIPIRLETIEGDTTALVAHYEEATVLDMPFNVMGVNSQDIPNMQEALQILVTEKLRMQYGATELIRFNPWSIGTNSVKLAAKAFAIYPENGVLSLALQTNLELPEGLSIQVGDALPEGVPMSVQMHPLLLLGMAQRMLAEEVIPRRYDDDGVADPEGYQAVTLRNLTKSGFGDSAVDVEFRVWRTGGGYCGFADAITALELGLTDDGIDDRITVTPTDDLRIVRGEGVGDLYEDSMDVVNENKGLVDAFKKSLADQIGVTVNYSELSVDGANIVFDALALSVAEKRIDILLDFLVLDKEGG